MTTDFLEAVCANGNYTLSFKENGKTRRIIFTKSTEAHIHWRTVAENISPQGFVTIDDYYKARVGAMRVKGYIFKANANNPSIFRPIAKSLLMPKL